MDLHHAQPATSAEAQLLLCCARLKLEGEHRARALELIASGIDWDALLVLARRHGLRPLLFRHLEVLAPDAVPRQAMVALWTWHERLATLHARAARELTRVIAALEVAGVPALPFKGPALAAFVYDDLALREFSDLDIVVRPQDVERAEALLLAQGYRWREALHANARRALLVSRHHCEAAFVHPGHGTVVELHWRTDADFPLECFESQPWWSREPSLPLQGDAVRCLGAEDLLMALCLHGSKHHWTSLAWLVDVAQLIRLNPQLDVGGVVAMARALGCERRVALGLHLAARLLDAPVPATVRDRVASVARVRSVAAAITVALLGTGECAASAGHRLRTDLALCDTAGQRLRQAARVLLAPSMSEWSRWPLPLAWRAAYVPLRLARLSLGTTANTWRTLARATRSVGRA